MSSAEPKQELISVDHLSTIITAGIQEVKGSRICLMDFGGLPNSVAQRFIVCEGGSNTQVDAIARSVEKFTQQELGERPGTRQGLRSGQWTLLDYFDVVVHIFHKDWRGHYGLEELWADAEIQFLPELLDDKEPEAPFAG